MKQSPNDIKKLFNIEEQAKKSYFVKTFTVDIYDAEQDQEEIQKAAKASTDEFTGIASAEIADSAGDIVMIEGIDTTRFDSGPLPLLSNHNADKIAGVITKIFKSNVVMDGAKVKVLKITASLNDTEFGKYWKQVKESGLPLRLSIGALVKDAELIKNKKGDATGIRYLKSELLEVSVTPVPANSAAQETKSVDLDTNEEDIMNKEQYDNIVKKLEDIEKSLEVHETRLDEIASNIVKEVDSKKTIQPIEPTKADESKSGAEEITKQISELVKQLSSIKKV